MEDFKDLVSKITERVIEELGYGAELIATGADATQVSCVAASDSCSGCGLCVNRKTEVVETMLNEGASRIGSFLGVKPKDGLAKYIDHTLLKADATKDELEKVCEEARKFNFSTVCVNSSNIPYVAKKLSGSSVKPIAVVGFPLGASSSSSKAFEARQAIRSGAREIDMVINIGALKSRDYGAVMEDIIKVVSTSKPYLVKVILEVSALNEFEKVIACALAKAGGAGYVKTSTGFGSGGATIEDVRLMRLIVGDDMGVKASGGIKTTNDAQNMIEAGANRIGASASVGIVCGKKVNSNY